MRNHQALFNLILGNISIGKKQVLGLVLQFYNLLIKNAAVFISLTSSKTKHKQQSK